MSMLARFKKPGGIDQLVTLLESCGPKKKEALVKNIETEDKAFAQQVLALVLTVDKIMSWNPLILAEILPRMQKKVLLIFLKSLTPEKYEAATHVLPPLKKRDVEREIVDVNPTPGEIEIAGFKLIEATRSLMKEGGLKLDPQNNPVIPGAAKKVG